MSEGAATAHPRWNVVKSIAFALCLAASVAFAAELDLFAGGLLHLPHVNVALVLGYCALPAAIGLLAFRTPWAGRGLLVTAAVVGVLVFTPWHPRKRFVDDLFSIRIGMTVAEVERVMGAYERRVDSASPYTFPDRPYRGPADRQIGFAWNSTDGAYDADVGEVTFFDGRVVHVEFQAD
jgi:hypothetical protein